MAHRDELLFQTVHQSSELWLKLAWTEVEEATRLLERGRARRGDPAAPPRGRLPEDRRLRLLDMLEQMSPWEYTRDPAACSATAAASTPPASASIRTRLAGLGEAFHELRRERGPRIVELYQRGPRVRGALPARRAADRVGRAGRRSGASRHYKVVARVIGDEVVGTQGTPVELLGGLINQQAVSRSSGTRATS